jgi:DNA-binding NtrC family response regulator
MTSKQIDEKAGAILIVDDNKNVLSALRILLENYFGSVHLLNTPNQLPAKLKELSPDVVLLDMNFSAGINTGNEGIYWLTEIKKIDADLPVVLFTAFADIELAVRALKEGASDFVVKPWDNAKLVATLQSAFLLRRSRKEVKRLREKQDALNSVYMRTGDICRGKSLVMNELWVLAEKVAKTDANVLITGENGTGKEVIAREIHCLSRRSNEVFVAVDMGAITGTLFESEFFGHVKGAFTDAKADRAGKFEAAQDGTLFLDEIGNLEPSLQAKLLAVLQSRQVVRVGGNKPVPVDIRLICATNRNIFQMVEDNHFREDLLYRINTIHIEIPPLRNRKEDIAMLAGFFLDKYSLKYEKRGIKISGSAGKLMESYHWPGNIRELQHAIEKAVILCDGDVLQPEDFALRKQERNTNRFENMTLEEAEKMLIGHAMQRNNGNMSAIAAELGISRPTLYGKINKYGL